MNNSEESSASLVEAATSKSSRAQDPEEAVSGSKNATQETSDPSFGAKDRQIPEHLGSLRQQGPAPGKDFVVQIFGGIESAKFGSAGGSRPTVDLGADELNRSRRFYVPNGESYSVREQFNAAPGLIIRGQKGSGKKALATWICSSHEGPIRLLSGSDSLSDIAGLVERGCIYVAFNVDGGFFSRMGDTSTESFVAALISKGSKFVATTPSLSLQPPTSRILAADWKMPQQRREILDSLCAARSRPGEADTWDRITQLKIDISAFFCPQLERLASLLVNSEISLEEIEKTFGDSLSVQAKERIQDCKNPRTLAYACAAAALEGCSVRQVEEQGKRLYELIIEFGLMPESEQQESLSRDDWLGLVNGHIDDKQLESFLSAAVAPRVRIKDEIWAAALIQAILERCGTAPFTKWLFGLPRVREVDLLHRSAIVAAELAQRDSVTFFNGLIADWAQNDDAWLREAAALSMVLLSTHEEFQRDIYEYCCKCIEQGDSGSKTSALNRLTALRSLANGAALHYFREASQVIVGELLDEDWKPAANVFVELIDTFPHICPDIIDAFAAYSRLFEGPLDTNTSFQQRHDREVRLYQLFSAFCLTDVALETAEPVPLVLLAVRQGGELIASSRRLFRRGLRISCNEFVWVFEELVRYCSKNHMFLPQLARLLSPFFYSENTFERSKLDLVLSRCGRSGHDPVVTWLISAWERSRAGAQT